VSIGTKCNWSCWYCFREGVDRENDFLEDTDSFSWLLKVLKKNFPIEYIRFTGGEPLLNIKIDQLINITKKCYVTNIGLTTNGTNIDKKIEKLVSSGLTSLAVHVENNHISINEQIHVLDRIIRDYDISVRINLVALQSNVDFINNLINNTLTKNIKFQILDLLPTNVSHEAFDREYLELDNLISICQIQRGFELICSTENVKVFVKDKQEIKFVKRWISNTKSLFCTKDSPFHPLLLTSDFKIYWCNHYGAGFIDISKEVIMRSEPHLLKKINNALICRDKCFECKFKL